MGDCGVPLIEEEMGNRLKLSLAFSLACTQTPTHTHTRTHTHTQGCKHARTHTPSRTHTMVDNHYWWMCGELGVRDFEQTLYTVCKHRISRSKRVVKAVIMSSVSHC